MKTLIKLTEIAVSVTKKTGIEPKIPAESHTTAKVVDDDKFGELNDVKVSAFH